MHPLPPKTQAFAYPPQDRRPVLFFLHSRAIEIEAFLFYLDKQQIVLRWKIVNGVYGPPVDMVI
ncbi:hypothetical protein CEV32_3796 [Brucella rhizosphaerae]|uniref:Uncharacterized protein n=1 Tax=Brucella rhizosphaerae TaxID=571254 RepID=A0A256FSM2_9HYPH|nr:hypothetical protein CEV32_3796 [Brucella rhizosphaerae]